MDSAQLYDFIFIGAGISSLMAAYRIKELKPKATILILEKGKDLEKRICPMLEHKSSVCLHCNTCSVVSGVAGAGSKNDGKYIIPDKDSVDYGGWLSDYLSADSVINYVLEVDKILRSFTPRLYPVYTTDEQFKQECLIHDLHLRTAQIRHYGSDGNFKVMTRLVDYLKERGVSIKSEASINLVDFEGKIVTTNTEVYKYNKIIIAVGRTGAPWLAELCKKNSIPMTNNRVDIGVRVEIPSGICERLAKSIYEPKIYYRSKCYGDINRTFCWNNGDAKVCVENNDGVLSVNGFANSSTSEKTGNSNFALLTSINFSTPFQQPTEYARSIASQANMISGGGVLVQRLGDLKNGQRTNEHRLKQSTTIPTLKSAVPGDISLALPKRILDNIIETIDVLNLVIKGLSNYDTLLYLPEIKTYSAKPRFLTDDFQIYQDVYCSGDCSSVTRSLSQAGAMGLYISEKCLGGK